MTDLSDVSIKQAVVNDLVLEIRLLFDRFDTLAPAWFKLSKNDFDEDFNASGDAARRAFSLDQAPTVTQD